MTIECYYNHCPCHSANNGQDEGPFCYEKECVASEEEREEYAKQRQELLNQVFNIGVGEESISAWYGPGGALVTDQPVPGCDMPLMTEDCQKFYGGPYMVAESMSKSTARTIAEALGLQWLEHAPPLEKRG